jgi:hypothetical protein
MYHTQNDDLTKIDMAMAKRVGETVLILVAVMFGLIALANFIA